MKTLETFSLIVIKDAVRTLQMTITHLAQVGLGARHFINGLHDFLLVGVMVTGESAEKNLGFAQSSLKINLLKLVLYLQFLQLLFLLFREIVILCIAEQVADAAPLP